MAKAKRSKRVDNGHSKTRRLFELFLKITRNRRMIAIDELENETWGDPRTVRRMLNELNDLWAQRNQSPLFEIVDSDLHKATRGKRFLRLLDHSMETTSAERLSAFPAYMEFMKVLRGTILVDQIEPIYKELRSRLTPKNKALLARTERKFVFVGKGVKNYSTPERAEVIDEVYDAILKEVHLEIALDRETKSEVQTVRPLGLVYFNGGLYLLAHLEQHSAGDEPYRFKIESIRTARALRKRPFKYPSNINPSEMFEGAFGIHGKGDGDVAAVELRFANNPAVKRYVRERKFSRSDELIENSDGTMTLKMQVPNLTEVVSWVLSWGGDCTVIAPQVLKAQVADNVKRMAKLYSA